MAATVPSVDDLIVALDIASRDEGVEIGNVVKALVERAKADGVPPRTYLGLATLIAFRRRNHEKSQASGIGAGERKCARTILSAVAEHDPAFAQLVLPLIPVYGSWRDLLVMAERMLSECSVTTSTLPLVVDGIVGLFAETLKRDATKEGSSDLPTSAAKYAPHEGRRRGNGVHNKLLADAIAAKLELGCADDKHSRRAAYRRLRAGLNKRLTEAGHLLEPLMATKRLNAIQFTKAPKGALAKNRKAILKDSQAAARWKRAMALSSKAVPDIECLTAAAAEALEEQSEPDASMRLMPLRLSKAIATATEQRDALRAKADALLQQLADIEPMSSSTAVDATLTGTSRAAALRERSQAKALPVVLSDTGSGRVRDDLLLAAYILARAQGLDSVAVDGVLVDVNDAVADATDAADAIAVAEADGAEAAVAAIGITDRAERRVGAPTATADGFGPFLRRVELALASSRRPIAETDRLEQSGRLLLQPSGTVSSSAAADLAVLCSGLASTTNDPDGLERTIKLLKADGMRLLLVHRLRSSSATCAFTPRAGLRPMPARGTETVDVAFVLDMTGSMGSWMEQCKTHIASIIRALQSDLSVACVRVALVGYRDWGERRNTTHDQRVLSRGFVPIEGVETVVDELRRQRASGGGDGPEDVIAAFEATRALDWKGDVRVAVFIADAPAHGYQPKGYMGDDFPDGLCPDQSTKLPELVRGLAMQEGVDLLCTKLGNYTEAMYGMFGDVYREAHPDGSGFGILSLESGAAKFREAILGSLSTALVSLIAPSVDVPGVQTFDGTTLSALIATSLAPLRESVTAATAALRAPSSAAAEAAAAERDDVIAAAAERVAEVEARIAAADDAGADAAVDNTDEDDDDGTEMETIAMREELAASKARLAAASSKPVAARAARGDAERLRAALEADELHPVRLALGLPLPSESLAVEAATTLLRAGVCIADLREKGYPQPFVEAMHAAGAALAGRM